MRQPRKFYRPSFECLERRDTPSNFGVTFNPATHTLSIVGTGQNDTITIEGNASDATMFALSSPGVDKFNNSTTFNSPTGVQNITMTLLGGNTVLFDDAVVPIDLQGSLTINGGVAGSGTNSFESLDMSVAKNVTITNGNGNTQTKILRDRAGFSSLGGNLSITNSTGVDNNIITDTNIGGNVTINNGHGDGASAGSTNIYNSFNTSMLSLIKGNVTISYLDGDANQLNDIISDYEIKGNVTFNHGSGSFLTRFDVFEGSVPMVVLGNVSITGSGGNTVAVGGLLGFGMTVGGSFTIATPDPNPASAVGTTLRFTNLQVGLATTLGLGNGSDSVTITTSTFLGALSLTTGAGNDATVLTTVDVNGNLTINGGSGANSVTATGLQVGGGLAVASANAAATNAITSAFHDLTVNGSVTINDGNGTTTTTIDRNDAGFNNIGGNVTIINATGFDQNTISDTNIGGSVIVNNGHGDGTNRSGDTEILNSYNTTVRSVIKGSVSVSYLDGGDDSILDAQIDGNFAFNYGTGAAETNFDGFITFLPVFILGNLSITGSGGNTVDIGDANHTGLIVGGSFTIATPATSSPSTSVAALDFNKLQVGTTTNIALGSGADGVTITASTFLGAFTLTTGAGNDTMTMTTVQVNGNLTFNAGGGANTFNATGLQVGGSLAFASANTVATNSLHCVLKDLTVNGSVTINNGNGATDTVIDRDAAGFNAIGGNVSITNGTGLDNNAIIDTNIGGSVTVNNGNGNAAGTAGYVDIFNVQNTSVRAVIKGNVSVSYLTGNVDDHQGIWDTEVDGSVTLANGTGSFLTNFDGFDVPLPVIIHGNLTVTGSGANAVTVGTDSLKTGLIVGGNFTISTPATMPATSPVGTLNFFNLQVTRNTNITLGNGNDVVTIDDSTFHGAFTLTTGAGADHVNLDTTAGTAAPTIFIGPVLINLGEDNDTVTREGIADANQEIIFFDTFVIHHGTGLDSYGYVTAREISPFGESIQWIM